MSVQCPWGSGEARPPSIFSTLDRGLSQLGGREPWVHPSCREEEAAWVGGGWHSQPILG